MSGVNVDLGCHALESQILNLSQRIYKIHVHLERNPMDLSAKIGVSKLILDRNKCLKELWIKDFGSFKRVYLKCESLYDGVSFE